MTNEEVTFRVNAELAGYTYERPPAGLHGVPWAEAKVLAYRDNLRQHLVPPFKANVVRDTVDQIRATPTLMSVWVVAQFGSYVIFFDDGAGEFGLAQRTQAHGSWAAIGVRGDLVGVYCAA